MADPNKHYAQQLNHNIDVWLIRTEGLAEGQTKGLYKKFPNLLRLIKQALASSQTRTQKLAILVKQAYWIPNEYGRWSHWEPLINNCLTLLQEAQHPIYIELLIQQGKCFSRTRQMERAIECHKKAEQLAQKFGLLNLLVEAQYNLCFNFRTIWEFESAINYGEKTLQIINENSLQNESLTATILNELGRTYTDLGDAENQIIAEEKFKYAFEHVQNDIDSNLYGKILVNIGINLQNQQKFESAQTVFLKAKEYFEKSPNELDKSRFWNSYGALLFQLEQYKDAELAFVQANNQILKESGDIFVQASINQNLGNVLTKQNRYREAEAYLWKAINVWKLINEHALLGNTYGIMGELYSKKKEYSASETFYNQAIEILKSMPSNFFVNKILAEFLEEKQLLKKEKDQ